MYLQVLVRAIAKELRAARTEIGEPGDELLGSRGSCLFEVNCGHVSSLVKCVARFAWVVRLSAVVVEVRNQLRQVHFSFSCLKPAFHRSLREYLELTRARAIKEEIRIATDVLDGRKRDCVHSLLHHRTTRCGKPGNSKSERSDEIVKFFGRQRTIDPAVTFSQIRVIVLCAQHDFERATAAHQPREML